MTSLRKRKKDRTRQELADVALRLFQTRGFAATSVDEIAAQAEVSRSTFFRYFPSKEAVAFPDRADRLARFERAMAHQAEERILLDRVRAAFLVVADEYVTDRERILAQELVIGREPALSAYQQRLNEQWTQSLIAALTIGGESSPRRQRQVEVLARAVMGAVTTAINAWLAAEGDADLIALGNEALDWLQPCFAALEPSS